LNFSRLLLASTFLCGVTSSAEATRNPTPPPSGIVVHLFGPDSIMSNMTDLPGEIVKPTPKPNGAPPGIVQPGSSQSGAAQPAGNAAPSAAAGTSTPSGSYEEPTVGQVLHQMFVVGDPNHPTTPSVGRTADRPPPAAN
jgi:hypothetical protein